MNSYSNSGFRLSPERRGWSSEPSGVTVIAPLYVVNTEAMGVEEAKEAVWGVVG